MLAYYMIYYVYIAFACISKIFPTLIININNYFCHDIIIYNLDPLIDVLILQIPIWKSSLEYYLPEYIYIQNVEKEWNWQVDSQGI